MTWDDVARRYETDKSSTGHGYMDAYEQHLAGRDIRTVLEIGVASGGSLHMWRELCPDAHVVGVDLAYDCLRLMAPFVSVVVADATDLDAMHAVGRLFGPFDLIVDDGSHRNGDIAAAYAFLSPYLAARGVYVIEDLYSEHLQRLPAWLPEGLIRVGTSSGEQPGPCLYIIDAP